MAANVETMFYVSNEENARFVPWHGLGTPVQEAPTSAVACEMGGLNWNVVPKPLQVCGGKKVPGYFANVRETDGAILGIVGERYKIVQNLDAFAFTDNLIGEDVRYETAGSLRGGKQIWLLAKMPTTSIGGDETEPYVCFTNTHDGSGSIKACMTPIRVVCNNTLNAALKGAKRTWKTRHTTNVQSRMDEAREVLGLAQNYMVELADYTEAAIKTRIDDKEVEYILDNLFKFDPKAKNADLQKARAEEKKNAFYVCYAAPDIAKFQGTAWGMINAMSDLVGHSMPHKNTANYAENNWGSIMEGAPLFDKMVDALCIK